MNDTVITVDSLSKSYKIGLKERQGRTFREMATDVAMSPIRRIRSLASGGSGSAPQEETFWALKDVSFEVKRGEVVGIIGRNGAGKSTLLKILSRITEPTSGEVRLRGRVASLLEVGTGFHPELTGRENIYLNGAILGMKRAEITRKFDEIVAFAEVEKFLDTPVKFYSSGMYVRLAFAVAAHLEPEILIVDEVLAVGDAEFQKKCLGKMREVAEDGGRTVLFVSHNMAAVQMLCDSALLLERGGIALTGSSADVSKRYMGGSRNGSPPMFPISGNEFDLNGISISSIGANGIQTYKPCEVEIVVRGRVECALGIYFGIEDSTGNLIAGIDGRDLDSSTRIVCGEVKSARFRIESLPILPGTYSLRVIVRNDSDYRTWEVEERFSFVVEPTAVYGHREPTPRWHGTTALPVRMTISGCSKIPDMESS